MSASVSVYDDRKAFHDNLKSLVKSENEQIFRILKKNNEKYTENSNGVFFDVINISEKTFDEMKLFMNFCIENRRQESNRASEIVNLATEVNTLLNDNRSKVKA